MSHASNAPIKTPADSSHSEELDAASPMHHHVAPVSTYFTVFAALMILLVVTYVVSLFDLDHVAKGTNLIIAMIIAVVKASLVVAIFMHVRDGSRLLITFATAAFLWLTIMFIMTFADYSTRGWVPGSTVSRPIDDNVRAASLEHDNTRDDAPVSPPKE